MIMTDKVSKDGNRLVVTEYETRTIDQYGDVENVCHWASKAEAIAYARKLVDDSSALAVVVEKHISRRPAFLFNEPDTYRTVATFGNVQALEAGGWNKD